MNEILQFAILFLTPVISSIPIALAWIYRPGESWARKLPYLSVLGLFVSLLITLNILFNFEEGFYSYPWIESFNINFVFVVDYLSKYMGALTAFIAFLIGVYGLEYMKDDYRLGWYWFFFNTFTASMLMVVYSDNLFTLLIGWEGLGIASWGLIGHWFRDDDDIAFVGTKGRKVGPLEMSWSPSFGGWRAISTIRFGDMPMFFAIAAIYALTGTLDIHSIPWHSMFEKIGYAGTVLLFIMFMMGPFTKSAQLPFSEWLMTAMTGPTTVSALLHSATMVAAGTYLFMRISWYIQPWTMELPAIEAIYLFILFLGLISALYGATVALGLRERKVLLAASTMSSLGLMFASASASYWLGQIALIVAFWYLIVHAFAKASLFLVAGHLIHATHDRFCSGNLKFAKKMKVAFLVTIIATVFLAGIPPFTAYWVKSAMDGLMEHLMEEHLVLPLYLLVLVSVFYSGFLAKFLSLNFIKGETPHHEHTEGGGLMKLAYSIMVSMQFVLLAVILLHLDEKAEFVEEGFMVASMSVGALVTVAYLFALYKPSIKSLSAIGNFLTDRMYMPFLNDYIVPKIGWVIADVVDACNKVIDLCVHQAIPSIFDTYSLGIRSIQTGYLKTYIKMVLGSVMVILVAISVMGWL
ncbi:NADH:ubiquinone oxidoreductase subunit 5 (chain L)/Multisubunit Na+/H+ antiporter, MnhA subunit [Archaeoglobus sulfaticallidus PM70-1]|uniref:NADH:ubiquinone oxidoreductase subunit 5 (Chain L)/Multisubunit Na+/H+ antiporter, MnhA subunit n=1 Tax=Archaeoglobus sulfaticallidus PM70-1 TaxID=387631 RepID=N0BDK7_9EURY|nr:NADH-quinone oxidoreductase subunit L [Archaeoglobus sulfaticallidus]AGK61719.1 NADH:ubiquinone oxidoreductase subunit 5 (chain L)/Multisubunit Na+/H+ antiporter, MnhA subunit [Archaeoglobus sulfaticallidus PM70-1]